jgi:hypothetical protein
MSVLGVTRGWKKAWGGKRGQPVHAKGSVLCREGREQDGGAAAAALGELGESGRRQQRWA